MKKLIFKNITNKYKDIIYNQAYYFSGNKEDAEDITQEVLIKLWHNIDQIKRTSAKSWLLKVTRNLCIDYSRKKREKIFSELDKNEQGNIIDSIAIDSKSNPEKQVICNDMLEIAKLILNQLPEKIRNIVIMRDIQDLKYELIAETMGLPLNSVKVYLHRGRKFLAKNIQAYSKHEFESR